MTVEYKGGLTVFGSGCVCARDEIFIIYNKLQLCKAIVTLQGFLHCLNT